MRLGALVVAGALSFAVAASGAAQAAPALEVLDLGDGFRYELLGAGDTPARVANPKSIHINVALKDDKLHADRAKLIEASDRLFESVLMGAAEKGFYERATVNIRRPGAETYEDFAYVRGGNDVWLRQAGKEPWKLAQDPKWTPPASEKFDIAGHGTFHVETAVEIPPPEGFHRAAEVDFVTATPVVDIQRKYKEIKALWSRIDREKMRADGFDMVLLGNFATPQRGRFHARKGFFVRIPRDVNGPWPELPERAPDDRDVLISKSEVPADELTKTIRLAFAAGLDATRLTLVMSPEIAAGAATSMAKVGFAEGTPIINFNPVTFTIKIQ